MVAVSGSSANAQVPLKLLKVACDLDSPTAVTTFPENEKLLVVAERGKPKIRVFKYDLVTGAPTPQVGWEMLDLGPIGAMVPASPADFVGVTGMAFHPLFDSGRTWRWLFVRYNRVHPSGDLETVVDAFPVSSGTPVASVAGRVNVYTHRLTASPNSHYSGQIQFDPDPASEDGLEFRLWIPMGDGSKGVIGECFCDGTPDNYWTEAQDDGSDLGKLILVMIDTTPVLTVSAPVRVAKGLRNPYSFSVDPHTGDVWLGDVGSREAFGTAPKPGDIHVFPGGYLGSGCTTTGGISCQSGSGCPNYGWPYWEGVAGTNTDAPSWCNISYSPSPVGQQGWGTVRLAIEN